MTYGMQPFLPGWKLLLPAGAVPTPGARQAFEAYEEKKAFGAGELRAWPCDTPRHFGPVGQEGRALGGPVAVREEVFQALGGLCRALPDEAAMQDLSARLRAAGVKMGYCPSAVVECPVPRGNTCCACGVAMPRSGARHGAGICAYCARRAISQGCAGRC